MYFTHSINKWKPHSTREPCGRIASIALSADDYSRCLTKLGQRDERKEEHMNWKTQGSDLKVFSFMLELDQKKKIAVIKRQVC